MSTKLPVSSGEDPPSDNPLIPSASGLLPSSHLVIVGHCPGCGNPIYGPLAVLLGEESAILRTCFCSDWRNHRKLPMETK